jgi:aspartyl-tRNA(Asn)/glutamyl-tRNA(Gln) amidotransferase subunit A
VNDASSSLPSASTIAQRVQRGAQSASSVVRECLARIERDNPRINALTQVFAREALSRAAEIDEAIIRGLPVGALAGVPIAIKENICTTLGQTTCASRMLANYASPFNATVIERLQAAGAIVIAKANMDEFAMGSSTEHSLFGPTRNPHDLSRVPGGSSGGSAAAVAAGLVPVALGSDTGGSIRQPASHCGVVGLKPTYGRVSRWGLVAYASSLDQIGPLARSVEDAALVTRVIAGHDPRDSTSSHALASDLAITPSSTPWSVCVPRESLGEGLSAGVAAAMTEAIERCRAAGATIIDVDLPHAGHAIAAYYLIATAEASSNLARFDGIRYGYRASTNADGTPITDLETLYRLSRSQGLGHEVQKRIMLGTYALSSGYYDAYYQTALKVRRLIKQDYDRALAAGRAAAGPNGQAIVLMPASPGPAFTLGSKASDPLAMYLEDVFTVGVNLAGLPAITVPISTERLGAASLPVGVQVIAGALDERSMLRIADTIASPCPTPPR